MVWTAGSAYRANTDTILSTDPHPDNQHGLLPPARTALLRATDALASVHPATTKRSPRNAAAGDAQSAWLTFTSVAAVAAITSGASVRTCRCSRILLNLMTIIGGAGGLAVEQLPIEQIQPGDYVVANDGNGKSYVYQVHVKRIEIDKQAGTSW